MSENDDDPLEGAAAPNCPTDLEPMQLAGTAERPFWRCASCGLVRV